MVAAVATLAALLALAGTARAHITFSPSAGTHPQRPRRRLPRSAPDARPPARRAVVKAPYFTTMMVISHGKPGDTQADYYSTQSISIQTPFGVKVTPEQKPGARLRPRLCCSAAG